MFGGPREPKLIPKGNLKSQISCPRPFIFAFLFPLILRTPLLLNFTTFRGAPNLQNVAKTLYYRSKSKVPPFLPKPILSENGTQNGPMDPRMNPQTLQNFYTYFPEHLFKKTQVSNAVLDTTMLKKAFQNRLEAMGPGTFFCFPFLYSFQLKSRLYFDYKNICFLYAT